MFALVQFKNIKGKNSLSEKLEDFEVIGVYDSLKTIEDNNKNYFSHKYRLIDNDWCYFVKKPDKWDRNLDVHELADKMVIKVDFSKEYINDYFFSINIDKTHLIRDIKLAMLCSN
jgi:hypothetical protein